MGDSIYSAYSHWKTISTCIVWFNCFRKPFLLVHRNRRRARKKRNYYANRKTSDVAFAVGDLVYYRNTARKSKLDVKWQPYYRNTTQRSTTKALGPKDWDNNCDIYSNLTTLYMTISANALLTSIQQDLISKRIMPLKFS